MNKLKCKALAEPEGFEVTVLDHNTGKAVATLKRKTWEEVAELIDEVMRFNQRVSAKKT